MLTSGSQARGPRQLARLADVDAWIDAWARPLGPEMLALSEACGRVLAEDASAAVDLPPFDRAAADGYAVQADETVGASAYNPLPFRLAPASAGAGGGRAVAVESGEPLPAGADAVVRPEHAMAEAAGTVTIIAPVFPGSEVERRGSHAAQGGVLAAAGRRLGPGEIGLIAGGGLQRVAVVARPRVRCLMVSDGIADPGPALAPGEVYDASGPMLATLVARDGGVIVELCRIAGQRAALGAALALPGADLILVAGGTGPGAGDQAAAALADAGELAVHGVALRPGESAGAGRAAGTPVFLLPGMPVACLWAYELLAGRALRRLAGRGAALPFPVQTLRTARKIVSEIGTVEVCPVRIAGDGTAEPMAPFAEAGLAAVAQADGFVLVPEASEGYPRGAPVTVHLYHERGRRPPNDSAAE